MAHPLSIYNVGSHDATRSPVACRKILGCPGTLPSRYGHSSKYARSERFRQQDSTISITGGPLHEAKVEMLGKARGLHRRV